MRRPLISGRDPRRPTALGGAAEEGGNYAVDCFLDRPGAQPGGRHHDQRAARSRGDEIALRLVVQGQTRELVAIIEEFRQVRNANGAADMDVITDFRAVGYTMQSPDTTRSLHCFTAWIADV